MHNMFKVFGVSLCGLVFACVGGNAVADGTGRLSRAGTQRMPTMPTLPMNTMGNSLGGIGAPTGDEVLPIPVPDPVVTCPAGSTTTITSQANCGAGTTFECTMFNANNNSVCVCGKCNSIVPTEPECDTSYTVDRCMNDIAACVNGGGLTGGMASMYDESVRNAIVNGMGLCMTQVEKCIANVHVLIGDACENIYSASADVWNDFIMRRVMPDYYNFVLRETGLTPYQAENTCLLLDRNAYGASFNAVGNANQTTSEYNNQVGAYNNQNGGVLIKTNPQGATVNTTGQVDANRGHYARWDASQAKCLVRVAAYNKDTLIKNSWLFGAAGDDKVAEAWRPAGSTFTCNKELFDFSLMNNTSTVAVVGVGGGTLVGAGVGALAGHGARDFDCGDESMRAELLKALRSEGQILVLNEFLTQTDTIAPSADNVSKSQCEEIVNLHYKYQQYQSALKDCGMTTISKTDEFSGVVCPKVNKECSGDNCKLDFSRCEGPNSDKVKPCAEATPNQMTMAMCIEYLARYNGDKCKFKPLNLARAEGTEANVYCTSSEGCREPEETKQELARLSRALSGLDILDGQKSNRLKTTAVGATVGAATGGVATGITALLESKNISCHVGDGLDKVGFKKSGTIDTLKDFYIKWNLNLPDTVNPTIVVNDCVSWRRACMHYGTSAQCVAAKVDYSVAGQPDDTITEVSNACEMQGSVCIENHTVAQSMGACSY